MSNAPRSLKLESYAKINLGLRILDPRPDGYHDIATVLTPVHPCDEITLTPAPEISMTCDNPNLASDGSNLCIRAAELVRSRFGAREGVRIDVKKRIPIGAGLGGGSSNAAAVLRGVLQLWSIDVADDVRGSLAASLGSDVPFFLRNGTAAITGRGETVEYFDLDIPYWILVVYPRIHCSTAWAYAELDKERAHSHRTQRGGEFSLKDDLQRVITSVRELNSLLKNDFEPVVTRVYPVIHDVKQRLCDQGAVFAQMSGSGSSVYGLFENETHAQSARSHFTQASDIFLTPPHFSRSLR